MMRSRERRFLGKVRAWQIVCPQCQKISKTIKANGQSSMPPKIIIKKLVQAGWEVGDNPKDDLCPECVRRPAKSHVKLASKALSDALAPVVTVNGDHRMHFADIRAAACELDAEHAKELIEVLRQKLPPRPPKKPKSEPPPKMAQSDYENWLSELEREH